MDFSGSLYVASASFGRGVFSKVAIPEGSKIESAHIIVIPAVDRDILDTIALHDYYFEWGEDYSDGAIALGYGSLYNHSYSPNAQYYRNLTNSTIDFFAVRHIDADEEITVNYNGASEDSGPLWFTSK